MVCAPRASTQPGVETKEAQRAVLTKITRHFLQYLSLIPAFSLCRYKTRLNHLGEVLGKKYKVIQKA